MTYLKALFRCLPGKTKKISGNTAFDPAEFRIGYQSNKKYNVYCHTKKNGSFSIGSSKN